jgi:thiol-disulfide isomerase/thioredoxin
MINILSDLNLDETLANKSKVVINFYADWCGVCKAFSPEFERIIKSEESSDISFFQINAPDNPKSRLLAGVYSLPFFVSFEKGKLLNKVASADKKKIRKMISDLKNSTPVAN